MKKLLLFLMLHIPVVLFAQNVQNDKVFAESVKKSIRTILLENGCTYEVSTESLMLFKYQGSTYALIYDEDDPHYISIVLPNVYTVDNNRRFILEGANKVTNTTKLAKVCIVEEQVWITAEMLIYSTAEMMKMFERSMDIITTARTRFYTEIL